MTKKKVSFKRNNKAHLIEFFDKNPRARVSDAVNEFTRKKLLLKDSYQQNVI